MELAGIEPEWFELDGAEFLLRPLTPAEMTECQSYSSLHNVHTMFTKYCEYAITDWKGIEENGEPVPFSKDLIVRLPTMSWATIARHVHDVNSLEAEDEKN